MNTKQLLAWAAAISLIVLPLTKEMLSAKDLKLVAEPEQRILDMRIHGNRFLEIRWNDADAGRPQDVEVRTTYKPVVSVYDGAWKITFEKP